MLPIHFFRKCCCSFFLLVILSFQTGCMTGNEMRDIAGKVNTVGRNVSEVAGAIEQAADDSDEVIVLLRSLQKVNTASSPINPLAVPIGAGLSGIIAVLEALRRKEQAGRKYAEHKLNNGSNSNAK